MPDPKQFERFNRLMQSVNGPERLVQLWREWEQELDALELLTKAEEASDAPLLSPKKSR